VVQRLRGPHRTEDMGRRLRMTPEEIDQFFEGPDSGLPPYKDPPKQPTKESPVLNEPTNQPVTAVQLGGRKVILTYNRSKEQQGGGWAKVEAAMEVDLPPGTDAEGLERILARETSILKSHVLTELDLPFTYDEDTSRVMEVFGASTVVQAPAQAGGLQAPPAQPFQQQPPAQGGSGGVGWEDIAARLQDGTLDQVYYDNRHSKKNPNSPDFNVKQPGPDGKRKGFWIYSQYPNQACPDHLLPVVAG